MDLRALLPKGHVVMGLSGDTRAEVFQHLAAPLVDESLISDAATFLADLERREADITTQMDGGIALPHARSTAALRLAVVVGIAPAPGLVFGDGASERCRLFVLIAIPFFAPTAHLPVLQALADFAHDPKRVAKLLSCTTPAQVIKALTAHKG